MTRCNIILLEDNKGHRENLSQNLREDYRHVVNSFRDLVTFREGCDDGSVLGGFDTDFPTVIIMDIMMAEELDSNAPFAPPSPHPPAESGLSDSMYCDDTLGLKISKDIRSGEYKCIENDTPILFFTATQINDVIDEIECSEMKPSLYLEKPAWINEVQEEIEKLLKQV